VIISAILYFSHFLPDVYVLYTSDIDNHIETGLDRLVQEFERHPPYQALRLHRRPILHGQQPLTDIATDQDARLAFQTIYKILLALKRKPRRVHVSIVGLLAWALVFKDGVYRNVPGVDGSAAGMAERFELWPAGIVDWLEGAQIVTLEGGRDLGREDVFFEASGGWVGQVPSGFINYFVCILHRLDQKSRLGSDP